MSCITPRAVEKCSLLQPWSDRLPPDQATSGRSIRLAPPSQLYRRLAVRWSPPGEKNRAYEISTDLAPQEFDNVNGSPVFY